MNLSIYKPERQSLTTVEFLKDISNQIKIRDISEEDFKFHLIKTIVSINALSGIKNPMDDIVKTDIKEMILMRFKALSFDEISYAFKKERYGDLTPRTEHFQLFDAKYVSEVLDKFVKWKKDKIIQLNLNQPKPEEVSISDQEKENIMLEAVDRLKREVKHNLVIESSVTGVYMYLYAKGVLPPHTLEFREKYKKRAIPIARGIAAGKARYSLEDHRELDSRIKLITEGKGEEVKNIAKRLILQDYFKTIL